MSSAAVPQRSSVVSALPSPTFPAPSAVNRSGVNQGGLPRRERHRCCWWVGLHGPGRKPFMSGHAPSVGVGRGEVVVVKRRQVSVHAATAGVHAHPPAVRQDTIDKTQGVAVGAVGAHVTHPPHRAAATRRRVMLHRRDHSRRGCCPCRSPSTPIPDHAQRPLASGRHRHASPVVNTVAGVPVEALTISSMTWCHPGVIHRCQPTEMTSRVADTPLTRQPARRIAQKLPLYAWSTPGMRQLRRRGDRRGLLEPSSGWCAADTGGV